MVHRTGVNVSTLIFRIDGVLDSYCNSRQGCQEATRHWIVQQLPHPVIRAHLEQKLSEGECSRSPDITRIGQQMDTPLVGETIEDEAGIQRMPTMMKDIMRTGMMMMTAVCYSNTSAISNDQFDGMDTDDDAQFSQAKGGQEDID